MTIRSYLKRFDLDKRRLLKWIDEHGGSVHVAKGLLKEFVKKDRYFQDGRKLEKTLLELTHSQQGTHEEVFHSMTFKEKIKWLWTRKQS